MEYEKYRPLMKSAVSEFIDKLIKTKLPLSITITGKSIDSRIMENINDVDILIVFTDDKSHKKPINTEFYKKTLELAEEIREKYTKDNVEVLICPKYGPIRPQPEKGMWKLQLQIMCYTPERLLRISPVSCLARYSWQLEDPIFGQPFRKYFSLDKITLENLKEGHQGIDHLIKCINGNYREYWVWLPDNEGGYKLSRFEEKITSNELLLEFLYYANLKTGLNYIRAKKGYNVPKTVDVFDKFGEVFPKKDTAKYLKGIDKEKADLRQDSLKITSKLISQRKKQTLSFLNSLYK